MILDEQGTTPVDLHFRLFGVPVRVHPFFWIVSAGLGWDLRKLGFEYVFIWIACCFFSILMHEMGHVMMGRAFGSRGHIVLQGLCGLAIGSSDLYDRWKRVLVILAGPGIQLVFAALLLAALATFGDSKPIPERLLRDRDAVEQLELQVHWLLAQPSWPKHAQETIWFLFQINMYWALMNLLPVLPLDGGQVSREFFTWRFARTGVKYSLVLSIVTASVVALNSVSAAMNDGKGPHIPYVPTGGFYLAIFFGLLAVASFMQLQQENARGSRWRNPDDDEHLPWERDADWWKK